jgi:hypothetical protein
MVEAAKPMAPHQQRVVIELEELVHKIDKLTEFLKGDLFQTIPNDEKDRLERQHVAMLEYRDILAERIVHF